MYGDGAVPESFLCESYGFPRSPADRLMCRLTFDVRKFLLNQHRYRPLIIGKYIMDTFPLWEHVVIYLRLDIFNVDVMHAFMSGR